MADDVKNRDNKDAEESGRPVQLDREEQGGKMDQPDKDKHQDKQGQGEREPTPQPAPNR
jgi:hypothetical protein